MQMAFCVDKQKYYCWLVQWGGGGWEIKGNNKADQGVGLGSDGGDAISPQ